MKKTMKRALGSFSQVKKLVFLANVEWKINGLPEKSPHAEVSKYPPQGPKLAELLWTLVKMMF